MNESVQQFCNYVQSVSITFCLLLFPSISFNKRYTHLHISQHGWFWKIKIASKANLVRRGIGMLTNILLSARGGAGNYVSSLLYV